MKIHVNVFHDAYVKFRKRKSWSLGRDSDYEGLSRFCRDPNLQLHLPLLFGILALGKLDGGWLVELVGSRLFSTLTAVDYLGWHVVIVGTSKSLVLRQK